MGAPFCKSGDAIRLALQQWVPPHFWPHANMVLVSYGQLFATMDKALKIREIVQRNDIMANQLLPLLNSMLSVYQPNFLH